jgi:hypothetical protein
MGRTKILSFAESKEIVRTFEFQSCNEFFKWVKSNKPKGIPCQPQISYAKNWKGWSDFLGRLTYISFQKARKFVRRLQLHDTYEWEAYCKSGFLPKIIPSNPSYFYKDQWKGIPDWLGVKNSFASYNDLKKLVRDLKITTLKQYTDLKKRGIISDYYPASPADFYKNWKGYRVLFGTVRPKILSFEKAKQLVQKLGVATSKEYNKLSAQHLLPACLPTNPPVRYS